MITFPLDPKWNRKIRESRVVGRHSEVVEGDRRISENKMLRYAQHDERHFPSSVDLLRNRYLERPVELTPSDCSWISFSFNVHARLIGRLLGVGGFTELRRLGSDVQHG